MNRCFPCVFRPTLNVALSVYVPAAFYGSFARYAQVIFGVNASNPRAKILSDPGTLNAGPRVSINLQ